uniref:Uncharacterized protein n=1 Tax=Sinocyclocheilus anshuiensis TaxID=1608454 RepID=A0A671R3Z2_9TELE
MLAKVNSWYPCMKYILTCPLGWMCAGASQLGTEHVISMFRVAGDPLDDCALQLSHIGTSVPSCRLLWNKKKITQLFSIQLIYSNFELGFYIFKKLYNSTGRELRRALFSLKQIFQVRTDHRIVCVCV